MSLILAPSFDEQTREQIELHLGNIRARRMSAAIEYNEGVQAKLHHESDKVQARHARAYEMLKKKLDTLAKSLDAAEDQLAKCESLRQELGLIHDLIEDGQTGDE